MPQNPLCQTKKIKPLIMLPFLYLTDNLSQLNQLNQKQSKALPLFSIKINFQSKSCQIKKIGWEPYLASLPSRPFLGTVPF